MQECDLGRVFHADFRGWNEVDHSNGTARDVKLIEGCCSIPRCIMAGTKKRHPAAFKAKAALEAAQQTRTAAELGKAFPVHPVPISRGRNISSTTSIPSSVTAPPRAGGQAGPPGRTLREDRPTQHGDRTAEKKPGPRQLTRIGRSSNLIILI
jgi:hypothetical protein